MFIDHAVLLLMNYAALYEQIGLVSLSIEV